MKKTIVFIAPHLSTGGMPQYLFKQIETIHSDMNVYCIEWDNVTGGVLVVQRNKIVNLLNDKLLTLGTDKTELFDILRQIKPDIVHLQEIPELFMPAHIADKLYTEDRLYTIIETSHDSGYNVNNKTYLPDKFLMVSKYQQELYKIFDVPCDVVEYPIENKVRTKTREQALRDLELDPSVKHVINVGLFTPRKNQAEIIEYARTLHGQPIQFHFIGNQADNFKSYWEPLMKDFPSNCKWWNERTDVDNFYQAADLFLFTSRGNPSDMETMPLVVREALSWKVPSLIYNLPVYMGYFDEYDTIEYLSENVADNPTKIVHKLLSGKVYYTMNGEETLENLTYYNSTMENLLKYGDGAAQYFANFYLKELDQHNVTINAGDVFVDLGANIGMSAIYAQRKGAAEIHCFEPDPNMVNLIKKNVPSAKIYQYAIDATNKEIQLYHWPYNEVNTGPIYQCKTITLKDVIQLVGKKINYLKMDIEGFETTVFDNLTVEECTHIDKMMIEYHRDTGLDEFCATLQRKGFKIEYINRGYQSYIYARHTQQGVTVVTDYGFESRWDAEEQKIFYKVKTDVDFPVIVTLREYKSDAILWSAVNDRLPANIEFWMIPIAKHMHDYSTDPNCMGIKFCIYRLDTEEQIYEMPFVQKFVNIPSVILSNRIPYCVNYTEFYVQKKYDKWLAKPHGLVVDVGANVGLFTKYMLDMGYTRQSVMVECDKFAIRDIYRHFRNDPRVTIIPKALSNSTEPVTFYHSPDNPVISSTLAPEELEHHMAGVKGNVAYTIETVTIKELVDRYCIIDLLKIDIEGGEYDVILQAEDALFTNIRTLMIECHFFRNDSKANYIALTSKLRRLGYTIEEFRPEQENTTLGTSENIYAYKS